MTVLIIVNEAHYDCMIELKEPIRVNFVQSIKLLLGTGLVHQSHLNNKCVTEIKSISHGEFNEFYSDDRLIISAAFLVPRFN